MNRREEPGKMAMQRKSCAVFLPFVLNFESVFVFHHFDGTKKKYVKEKREEDLEFDEECN